VRVEGVPFARARSGFSRDFEDLVAFLATKTDKTTITRLSRVDWDTVGRICERVVAHGLDPARLDGLVTIGVDEVSWRRHHQYLTLVADHTSKKIVWGAPGKDTATLDTFFDDLGPQRAARIEAVSMDMGAAFNKSVRAEGHAPQAIICIDPFHAVQLVTDALDVVRRIAWNDLRQLPDQGAAKRFKGARWALLKRPENLTDDQCATLRRLRRRGGDVWRAYTLKESFRAIFAGDLDPQDTGALLDRWCSQATRSRLPSFVRVSKTIRKHREGILAAIELGVNNARAEGLIIWSPVRAVFDVADGPLSPRRRHVIWSVSPTAPGRFFLSLPAFRLLALRVGHRRGHVYDATSQVSALVPAWAPDKTEQPRSPHHSTGLRLPLRPSSPRPGHALLRTHHPAPTPRTRTRMTHTHAGVCPERRVTVM
jgi:transposase